MDPVESRIRAATENDLSALQRLEERVFSEGYMVEESWEIALSKQLVLLSEKPDGSIEGFVVYDPADERYVNNITLLGVDTQCQRKGVGRALLRAAIERMPPGSILLTVEAPNQKAQNLYHQEGFEERERLGRFVTMAKPH